MKTIGAAAVGGDGKARPIAVDDGRNAWTPMLAPEQDGTRTLIKIADWIGGTGTKPATGYLATGGVVAGKAQAFNFNAARRLDVFSGLSAIGTGIASIVFDPPYPAPPTVVVVGIVGAAITGVPTGEVIAGSVAAGGCQVRVQQRALVTGVLSLLGGATVALLARQQ